MSRTHWLERLGLDRPPLRAWALYDWANSAFVTTVITAVFPVYFASVVAVELVPAAATALFAAATTVAQLVVAGLAPVLGVIADERPSKKRLMAAFVALGVLATTGLAIVGAGDVTLSLVLFAGGNVGLMASFVFYDALLPHIAGDDELDRVSSAGYALGYLGGGALLALNLIAIERPRWFGLPDAAAACRASFASVALWWAVFTLPLLLRVPEPVIRSRSRGSLLAIAIARLAHTGRDLRRYPQALRVLVAYLLYNDGIGTVYRMAAIYATEIGLSRTLVLATLLGTQFASIPFAFAFGALAGAIGAKRAIGLALAVYALVGVLAFHLRTGWQFVVLAGLVAMVQGGAQALTRSLFAALVPRGRSAQFFSLFGVFDKVSGVLGPLVFAAAATVAGSSRSAILSVVAFVALGGLVLASVDVRAGQRAARANAA